VAALTLRPGPPNHWSQSWVELELGLAYAAANKIPEAVQELTKSLLVADRYDHPLTCVGLLELGRLAFEQGKYDAAITYLHEATISAAFFDRYDVMEEAFRLGAEAHAVSGQKGLYPPLLPASLALSKKSRPLAVSLLTSLAEQLCSGGELSRAAATIAEAHSAQGRHALAQGAIGSRLNFQSARVAFHAGDAKSGGVALAAALSYQKGGSPRLFQIGLADLLYKGGGATDRIADLLFSELLREPTANDWTLATLDTLAVGLAPHPLPYEHWFEASLARKDQEKALNIADRLRRHRFFVTQPLGGRLLALRWILEGLSENLSQDAALQRQNLLLKFPKFGELSRRSAEIRTELQTLPVVPTDDSQIKRRNELLTELTKTCTLQETMLQAIALDHVASELVFPPLRETKEIQQELPENTLVFSYLVTSRNVHAFALAKDRYGSFTVAQPTKVRADVMEMLKHLGLNDRNFPVTADELKANGWRPAADRLVKALTNNTSGGDWAKYRELVVVPDGVLWYLPFEALPVPAESQTTSLAMQLTLRYAPTLSLAIPGRRGNRPAARTLVIGGKLLPRDEDGFAKGGWEAVAGALPGSTILPANTALHPETIPCPSATFSTTFDRLIVLKDADDSDKAPFGWSPLAVDAGKPGGTLADWIQLPFGVDQAVLPGFHTQAESSLKRGGTGDELFLATCGLMASGCRTILLSRWRVGGQSTVDLMREFVQELPHQPADVAWQRSVRLASGRTIDAALEGRLKTNPAKGDVSAEHPFFWSGYMLVDTGVAPHEDAEAGGK